MSTSPKQNKDFIYYKALVFACLFVIGSSSESNPKFTLTKDRLLGEVPSVSIEFPDGSTDTLVLRKYYSNNQDRMAEVERCNFIGHLAVVSINLFINYRISANSFHGNYSFLNLALCTVTFGDST